MSEAEDRPQFISPFPNVSPAGLGREPIKLPHTDPRTYAFRILRDYIAELTFYRPGNVGEDPIAFSILPHRFHIEEADADTTLELPCIVVKGNDEKYDEKGYLGPRGYDYTIDNSTRDVYGKGTVLQTLYEHTEDAEIEIWTSSKPERRSLIAGLQVALPSSIGFVMKKYWDQIVYFTILSINRGDESETVQGRRVARIRLQVWFHIVNLIYYETMKPVLTAAFDVDEYGFLVVVDDDRRILIP